MTGVPQQARVINCIDVGVRLPGLEVKRCSGHVEQLRQVVADRSRSLRFESPGATAYTGVPHDERLRNVMTCHMEVAPCGQYGPRAIGFPRGVLLRHGLVNERGWGRVPWRLDTPERRVRGCPAIPASRSQE